MFATRRSIEFEYAFSAGRWRLIRAEIDWEVAKFLGPILLNYPRILKPPLSPQYFAAQLLVALGKYKLDGGDKREVCSDGHYHFAIVVDGRPEKSQH